VVFTVTMRHSSGRSGDELHGNPISTSEAERVASDLDVKVQLSMMLQATKL
jgi:hypothetical protein